MPVTDWTKLLLDSVQSIAIVLGGLYALYEYRRFRRYSPKIEFNVDFSLCSIDTRPGHYLLDIEMKVKNVGQVRMYLPEINVGVKTLGTDDIETALEAKKRFRFNRELIPKHNIVPKPDDPWWIDAGVTQVFPYPVAVDGPEDFVQVNAEFYYYKDKRRYLNILGAKRRIREGYHQASLIKSIPN